MVDRAADLEQAVALKRVHQCLAEATGPAEILAAMGQVCEPYGPAAITLFYSDVGGTNPDLEVVAAWGPGLEPSISGAIGQRFPFSDMGPAEALRARPHEPLFAREVHGGAGVPVPGLPGAMQSFVLLPLHSKRHAGWQGIVAIQWLEPHDPAPAERVLYEFLVTTLSESIAAERTMRAYQESLGENAALLRHAEVALQESQRQSTMLRTLLDHLPLAVIVVRVLDGKMDLIQTAGTETVFVGKPGDPLEPSAFTAYAPGAPEPMPPEQLAGMRALMTGQTCRQELEIPRPDGTRVLIDCTATPMHYEGDPAIHLVLLYNDVTEQRRAERERMAAQEELLKVQALALTERSTPLIPIREDILVMPLVGAIDEERGQQIIDTLVNLGGRTAVKAAIIDVTGVHNLDTAAARALLGAAQALRLRGVRSILTGIQSSAAITLVSLGIDLSAIAVRGTLQDGVALAIQG